MKRIFFPLLAVLLLVACNTEDKQMRNSPMTAEEKDAAVKDTANFTNITWIDSTTIDLGKIKKGASVEVSYRFKNTGTNPLVIQQASAGCGCTVTKTPQGAIPPGGEDVIKGTYDSKSQPTGKHNKYIYVTANTNPNITTLTFNVEVEEDK